MLPIRSRSLFRLRCATPGRVVAALAVSLLLIAAERSAAGLYVWTDDEGRVHYSNEPRPGSAAVGAKPLALEAEEGPREEETDRVRRARLEVLRAERWVDRQAEFPSADPGAFAPDADSIVGVQPAAPGPDRRSDAERACQHRHGMSCLQYDVWMQGPGKECRKAGAGAGCLTNAEYNEQRREAARRREAEEAAWRAQRLRLDD